MKKIVILGVSVVVGLAAFAVVSSASSFNSGESDFDGGVGQHHERYCGRTSNDEWSLNREKRVSRRGQMMNNNAVGDIKNNRGGNCYR
ncbi:hypothetical protein [Vagococcus fessus]|uniref:Uncharacterized protein n=1 Tax=Vagococcus fessus TaxID=120370 RepID=A0A430A7Z2_9ENTE|nr:hypothetical protein [Vagococcus fessus]RSU03222.1 hypothetical protein CBF31_05760 [Vagococcus fessus]